VYIKNALIVLSLFISLKSISQIRVSDIGDYKQKVDSALLLIKKYDLDKYNLLLKYCNKIDYIIGSNSTTSLPNTIVININDLKLNSTNNLSSVIVHESYHLYIYNERIIMNRSEEEKKAYEYELDYLIKVPNVELWIINHTKKMIKYYN